MKDTKPGWPPRGENSSSVELKVMQVRTSAVTIASTRSGWWLNEEDIFYLVGCVKMRSGVALIAGRGLLIGGRPRPSPAALMVSSSSGNLCGAICLSRENARGFSGLDGALVASRVLDYSEEV